jgi:hypothetical protein
MKEEGYRIPKKILGENFGGLRPVGRSCSRWEENFQQSAVSLLHIQNWKTVARNRQNWRKKTGESMTRIRAEEP